MAYGFTPYGAVSWWIKNTILYVLHHAACNPVVPVDVYFHYIDNAFLCIVWRRSGSVVEFQTLVRENTVTNPLHIGAVDGDSLCRCVVVALWRCYATTKQNHRTCTLQ